jgi:hypothetical protein
VLQADRQVGHGQFISATHSGLPRRHDQDAAACASQPGFSRVPAGDAHTPGDISVSHVAHEAHPGYWQPYTLADVNGQRCRDYVAWRVGKPWKSCKPEDTKRPARLVSEAAAQRELEDLRSAINYRRREGLCSEIVSVALPESRPRATLG